MQSLLSHTTSLEITHRNKKIKLRKSKIKVARTNQTFSPFIDMT